MSYAPAAALQQAVYAHLTNDVAVTTLLGPHIYDAMPVGTPPATYAILGAEDARDRSDCTGAGAQHNLIISVLTEASGFHGAKQVAAAISDALHNADLTLSRGQLIDLTFYRARAKLEGTGDKRRIDLTFRARVDDTL
ncbi:MAG: DUF3168 domain-containing protein [Roseovarius sp.]